MFKNFIAKLAQITRFDRIVNTACITIGAVEDGEQERLALKLPSDEVVVLEEQGERALCRQYAIPHDHFSRLPAELQAHELSHFTKNAPRELMLRTVQAATDAYPAVRAVVSSRYSPFDNSDVLDAVSDELAGMSIVSARVDRDDMRIQAVLPRSTFDVSQAKVGDTTHGSVVITNSEVCGAVSVAISLYRLVCRNGMTSAEHLAARVRHIWVKREDFIAKLRQAVADAGVQGEAMARLLRRSHDLPLLAIDSDGDRLSREVVRILRQEGLFTKGFQDHLNSQLGTAEPRNLFGAVNAVSDAARLETLPLLARQAHERAAGRMIQLAA